MGYKISSLRSDMLEIVEEDDLIEKKQYEKLVENGQQCMVDEMMKRASWRTLSGDVFDEVLRGFHNRWTPDKIWEYGVLPRPGGMAHYDRVVDAAVNVQYAVTDEMYARRDWIMYQARRAMLLTAECVVIRVKRNAIEIIDVHPSMKDARRPYPHRPKST